MEPRGNAWILVLSGVCAAVAACSKAGDEGDKGARVAVWPGCENAGAVGIIPAAPSGAGGGSSLPVTDEASLFDAAIEPALGSCRPCHVGSGLADVDGGRGLLLTSDRSQDRETLKAAWTALGGGVDANPILTKAAGTSAAGHSGGALWPPGSASYDDLKLLLSCWNDPSGCAAGISARAGSGSSGEQYPLLGDLEANGGRNYAAVYCEGKPDCASLPPDPRELIAGQNLENTGYAVYYNDAFELCQTDALFANQKRGNDLLIAQGKEPAYTAKPRPTSCGEWRAAVSHGRELVVSTAITGPALTVGSLVNIGAYLGLPLTGGVEGINAALESLAWQRYGWPKSPYRNPAPLPGEDPNATDGGSLQLPIALTQVKDEQGKWTGKLGITCFACHQGTIGQGEVVGNTGLSGDHPEIYGGSPNGLFLGLNGSNTDIGTSLWDTDSANGLTGPDSFNAVLANPSWITNRTRGTNAADQEVVALLTVRDFDTLDYLGPEYTPMGGGKDIPSLTDIGGGDQDIPSWWWQHNKTRYLWVGYGSAGSSREAFFPAATNGYDGHWNKRREGDFQDLDMWLNSVEAPKYVGPPVDTTLAEQGALLFHAKDLWADPRNGDIPRPPGGNGSCASCHGAYSPRFIHQPGYLPDPTLAGMSGYTVPLEILGTDAAQSNFFWLVGRERGDLTSASGKLWMSHPDAQEGYRMPEERAPGEGPFPDGTVIDDWKCALGAKGGYTAQPLHGVWASAPYFHNGSVPTVWDVLAPDTRPSVWRRQRVPDGEGTPTLGYRGFDTRLDRAYDYEKLGWKYEVLVCDPVSSSYSTSCEPDHDLSVTTPPDPATIVDERTLFNTYAYSKGNQGHAWTKVLTDEERRALIEYLKTL